MISVKICQASYGRSSGTLKDRDGNKESYYKEKEKVLRKARGGGKIMLITNLSFQDAIKSTPTTWKQIFLRA